MLLRTHPDFRLLWLGMLVSQLGDKVFNITLNWWVLGITHDPSAVAYLMAVSTLPMAILGPAAGALADRYNRRHLMLVCDLCRAVLLGCMAYMAYAHWHSLILIGLLTLLVSLFGLVFNPAVSAISANLVEPEKMGEAMALQSLTRDQSNLFGAAAGGALVAAVGEAAGLGLNGLSFLFSALMIYLIRVPPAPPVPEGAAQEQGGWAFIVRHPSLKLLLVVFALSNFFLVPSYVVIPVIAKMTLHGTAQTLGWMEASLALGSMVAGVLLMRRLGGEANLKGLFVAMVVVSVATAVLGIADELWEAMLCLAALGGSLGAVNIVFQVTLQRLTPDALKGRVFALVMTVTSLSFPLSLALTGWATDHLSVRTLMLVCGVGNLLTALPILWIAGRAEVATDPAAHPPES